MPVGTANNGASYGPGTLKEAVGSAQSTGIGVNTSAITTQQSGCIRAFCSDPLEAQTIAAQNWTIALGVAEGNASANAFLAIAIYVWRPSTGAKVGTIYDATTNLGAEWPTAETGRVATVAGSSVTAQAGDVIILEVWYIATQGATMSYSVTIYYDGTAAPTDGTATSNAASYLEAAGTITFQAPAAAPFNPLALAGD